MKDKVWYTASEFSAQFKRSRQWAFTLIKKGYIKAESFGILYRIHKTQLEKIKKLLGQRVLNGKKYLFAPRKRA